MPRKLPRDETHAEKLARRAEQARVRYAALTPEQQARRKAKASEYKAQNRLRAVLIEQEKRKKVAEIRAGTYKARNGVTLAGNPSWLSQSIQA